VAFLPHKYTIRIGRAALSNVPFDSPHTPPDNASIPHERRVFVLTGYAEEQPGEPHFAVILLMAFMLIAACFARVRHFHRFSHGTLKGGFGLGNGCIHQRIMAACRLNGLCLAFGKE